MKSDNTTGSYRLREAGPEDLRFLRRMLFEAAYWNPATSRPDLKTALAEPGIARYVEGWPRPGDAGVIAEDRSGNPIGAAWYRLFTADSPGYGYIDELTPELGLAVSTEWRGRGVGRSMLLALTEKARREGFSALCLSVASANPAGRLYASLGFLPFSSCGDSLTLRLDLPSLEPSSPEE